TALFADLERRLAGTGPAAPLGTWLLEELAGQRAELEELALLDEPLQQERAVRLADRLALLTLSCFLVELAGTQVAQTGNGQLLWIANRFAARLAGGAR
ncbi:MAG: hypothetical protein J2P38_07920, partial [Candidatus Dormibacteraeota bacterium]|nr:hypothetical protein [Candidatus Dormibacteraeota bacterium]